MISIFLAGTGTNIGKTVIAAALGQGYSNAGLRVGYWKPISSGTPSDTEVVRKHTQQVEIFSPCYVYETPISPHAAALQEKKPEVNIHTLELRQRELQEQNLDILLIEAAGGILVPLNTNLQSWLDFLGRIPELSTVLVTATGLGTLNHTAMSVRCLKDSGFEIKAIVMSGKPFHDNEQIVRRIDRSIPVTRFDECLELSQNKDWHTRCSNLAEFIKTSLSTEKTNSEWQEWDKTYNWHPFTQHKTAPLPQAVIKTSGVWIKTADGKKMIDGISSWWTNNIGHGREEIAQSCAAQIRTCDHVVFAGLTHKPASQLAHEVISLTNGNFDRVFFSDNGSTAVEIAAKIVFQHHQNLGSPQKNVFLSFHGGYHGDTIGAMSLGAFPRFHQVFSPLLFKTLLARPVTSHPSWPCPGGKKDFAKNVEELQTLVQQNKKKICAIIIEPLIQGAAGMLIQEERWLKEVGKIAAEHDIPLIFDEVFTALGRTGYPFAFQRAQVVPDILCLAKGLTGGTLPLALTLVKNKFFRSFLHEDKKKGFMHGHTFTGNPVACRAALSALDILQKENLVTRALTLEKCFKEWITQNETKITNPRALGSVLAFELGDEKHGNYYAGKATEISRIAAEHRLFLRPLGNTIYFVPPLTIDESELVVAFQALEKIIEYEQ